MANIKRSSRNRRRRHVFDDCIPCVVIATENELDDLLVLLLREMLLLQIRVQLRVLHVWWRDESCSTERKFAFLSRSIGFRNPIGYLLGKTGVLCSSTKVTLEKY